MKEAAVPIPTLPGPAPCLDEERITTELTGLEEFDGLSRPAPCLDEERITTPSPGVMEETLLL
tara:strand:- start:9462 stop:9650 length:189 start_codon:yes stop_codon:yes gene_type:complete